MPQSEEILNALKQAQKRYASYGITTVQDGYLMKEMVGLYQMLCTSHTLELDVVAYAGVEDYGVIATKWPNTLINIRPPENRRIQNLFRWLSTEQNCLDAHCMWGKRRILVILP